MRRTSCCNEAGLRKGAWTADEDQKLIAYIQEHGEGSWRTLPQKAGLQRCGKSCRLRWANYLRPDIKRGEISAVDEQTIIQLHATLGSRWSAIARHLPGRTDNEIKNYWNTHLKKRLTEVGLDPVTHKPIAKAPRSSSNSRNDANRSESGQLELDIVRPCQRAGYSRSLSASARLLNKLAAQLTPIQCVEKLQACQAAWSNSSGNAANNNDANSTETTPVSASTSAKLLNKMANTLATPSRCPDALKAIMSTSMEGDVGTGGSGGSDIGDSSNIEFYASAPSITSDGSYNIEFPMSISNTSTSTSSARATSHLIGLLSTSGDEVNEVITELDQGMESNSQQSLLSTLSFLENAPSSPCELSVIPELLGDSEGKFEATMLYQDTELAYQETMTVEHAFNSVENSCLEDYAKYLLDDPDDHIFSASSGDSFNGWPIEESMNYGSNGFDLVDC